MNATRSLDDRLEALRGDGALAYDRPGFLFVEALLARAEALDGDAAARLRARASIRLAALRDRLEQDRCTAERLVETLANAGADPDGAYGVAVEVGDYRRVVREAEGALRRARRDGGEADRARLERLSAQARAEGLALPTQVGQAGDDPVACRAAADGLAQDLFRHIVDTVRGSVTVARAADRLPERVGPYNPAALTAQVLAGVEALSPTYLRALLAGLEDLGSLRALPAPRRRRR